jgi:protocatechuate 3,4-dioxygenase beta subunit
MNKLGLIVNVAAATLLAGCARGGISVATPTTAAIQPPADLQETATLPASTPLKEPILTDTPEVAQVAPEQTVTVLPGATPLPCSRTLTSPNQEGPFYTPGSPERSTLIDAGLPGTPILITGRVFDQACNPIAGAKLDFWLADVNGEYDNSGYRLRGHQFSDDHGNYSIESIEPTPYTGRPPHIHVKVFAPDGRELLTTQMYFPGSEASPDVQAAPDLLVGYQGLDEQGRQVVWFNFIVRD